MDTNHNTANVSTTKAPAKSKTIKADHNAKSDGAQIVKNMIASGEKSDGLMAQLTAYMFGNALTFDSNAIRKWYAKSGPERTKATDDFLSDISPDYTALLASARWAEGSAKVSRKEDGSNVVAQVETYRMAVKAIRKRFAQCMSAVYFLRNDADLGAVAVTKSQKSNALVITGTGDPTTISHAALESKGNSLLKNSVSKAKSNAGRKPGSAGKTMNEKAAIGIAANLRTYVQTKAKAVAEGKADIAFTAEEEAAFEDVAIAILASKRADDGSITVAELNAWLTERKAPFKVVAK